MKGFFYKELSLTASWFSEIFTKKINGFSQNKNLLVILQLKENFKKPQMKTPYKIIYSLAAITVTGILIYSVRNNNTRRRITRVAQEGYETAADLLFPKTSRRFKNLHYGPVLPHHDFE